MPRVKERQYQQGRRDPEAIARDPNRPIRGDSQDANYKRERPDRRTDAPRCFEEQEAGEKSECRCKAEYCKTFTSGVESFSLLPSVGRGVFGSCRRGSDRCRRRAGVDRCCCRRSAGVLEVFHVPFDLKYFMFQSTSAQKADDSNC